MKVISGRKRKASVAAAPSSRVVWTRQAQRRATATRRKTLRGILRVLRAHLPDFVERYHVKSLGVFGSYVREDATEQSDLDVLVEFQDKSPSLLKIVHFENELSDLLGIKVDLVEKKMVKPRILENVMKGVVGA